MIALAESSYLVAVALLVGSFINLATDRLPRGESLVRPRSHCRSCGRILNVVDLIPVGGYLIRGGRCAGCGVSIGASSPAVEAICGAFMLVALVALGPGLGVILGAAGVVLVGAAAVSLSYARAATVRRGSRPG